MIFIMKQVRYLYYMLRTTQDLFVGDNEYDFPNDLEKQIWIHFQWVQKN